MDKEQDRETLLFLVRIDDAVEDSNVARAKTIKRTRHIKDFSARKNHDDYQKAFLRLLRDLQVKL